MPASQIVPVKKLSLDLENFRTVPQNDEEAAIRAMISIHPEWFWALTESIVDDGYLPTENIIVLKGKTAGELIVKEGNRRIAAIKLIFGLLSQDGMAVPSHIKAKIDGISKQWKNDNKDVPCTIYNAKESSVVDRVVTLTHGKAQQAGRDHWNATARARHNRVTNKTAEPGLDLLESYLKSGRNLDAN